MKTLIFDLDGTILDTLEDLKNAVNHGLNFYNLPEKDLEFVRKAIGNGTQVLIKRCVPEGTDEDLYEKVFKAFKQYYLNHYDVYTKPYVGIKEMIQNLKKECRIAVVSNKDDDLTHKLITKEFPGLFDIIQGSYFDKPKKPNPYLISKVLEENCIMNADVLYIGDTDVDKESALNSHISYLLVNYGYRSEAELKKICPNDKSISTVYDLEQEINMWVKKY